jgi:hypothetical protein
MQVIDDGLVEGRSLRVSIFMSEREFHSKFRVVGNPKP